MLTVDGRHLVFNEDMNKNGRRICAHLKIDFGIILFASYKFFE